ncbi:glycosyl transferase family 2 [Larkinella arboricola]|uniref:Glycosyl transferase family 2 n=1 Tax=Larkinella arboricola TaxID=643671 RepID=A0A327X7C9_LARAB|nr:glycosyltransferase [Larkinella arboricola]RAK02559.1 glycosyl transferase family 2 [Larkinella arboricola]
MKASILINNYNYGKYIEKSILSALNQTYKNIEVIVYDDGSKDDSISRIKKYSKSIEIIANENYGKGHCWNQINAINQAFKKSSGDIIFLMDSDDCFFKDKVEKIVSIFEKSPNVIYVQHKFELVDEEDNILPYEKRPFFSDINVLNGIYFTKRLDFFFTQTSGQCFRRSFLQKILPLQEDELSLVCVDVRLTRLAAFEGDIISLQDKLTSYRIHTNNHSAALKNKEYYTEFEKQHITFFNNLAQSYNFPHFQKSSNIISYFRVLQLLLKSKMKTTQKWCFLKDWYKSYAHK